MVRTSRTSSRVRPRRHERRMTDLLESGAEPPGRPEFVRPPSRTAARSRADLDDLLAEVLASEQPDQLARCVLQPLGDILPVLDPALLQPGGHVREELRELCREIPDDEPAEGDPLDERCQHQRWD